MKVPASGFLHKQGRGSRHKMHKRAVAMARAQRRAVEADQSIAGQRREWLW
jgi:hypothetical protein